MPLAVQVLRGNQRQSRTWEVRWLVRRTTVRRRELGGTTRRLHAMVSFQSALAKLYAGCGWAARQHTC